MKNKTLKKILGWFLATLIIPFICICQIFADVKYQDHPFWDKIGAAVLAGYLLNIILAIIMGFILLVIWLILSDDY